MITKNEILILHQLSIENYGGADGIRDEGLLESAIARPYQTFGGENLYHNVYERAAAIAESLIINHPFVDGNKRTGFLGMFALLNLEGLTLSASKEEAYQTTIAISTGTVTFEEIIEWLKANTKPL